MRDDSSALALVVGLGAALAVAVASCGGGERAQPLRDPEVTTTPSAGGSGSSVPDLPDAGEPDASLDAGWQAAPNCERLTCRGAGKCEVRDGVAECVCDTGYVLSSSNECIVDENCIRLRLLEEGCRQRTGAEPAVSMFFGVETCAGTTVRPELLGDLSQAFKVLEDGNDVGEESYAQVFDRDVESFVALAVDLSSSLANDVGLLTALIGELKGLVRSLEPGTDEAPVSVALIAFGRTVQLVQPFTSDFSLMLATLDAIQQDPASAVADPGGTNLYGAVNLGQVLLGEAIDARLAATGGAIVATGTLVTISDGQDTAGDRLERFDPRLNLISIGISDDIDDSELTRIGPHGSFLAPAAADWADAFDRVSQRVAEHPDRAYLLGYCSPAVAGQHDVVVTLANHPTQANATCKFNAAEFGVGDGVCTPAYIDEYCEQRDCGSFLACGPCATAPDAGPPTQSPDDSWEFTN